MLLYQNGYIFFDPPCNNYSNVNIDHDNDKKVIIGKQREQWQQWTMVVIVITANNCVNLYNSS